MTRESYQWALLRVVPRVERGEQINVGAVLFCRGRKVLAIRLAFDEERLRVLDPGLDIDAVRAQLDGIARIAEGDPHAGRIARMDAVDRFGFITAPSSTVVQPSAVHVGLCDGDPHAELDRIVAEYVAI